MASAALHGNRLDVSGRIRQGRFQNVACAGPGRYTHRSSGSRARFWPSGGKPFSISAWADGPGLFHGSAFPGGGFRLVRHSVLAAVDAFEGEATFFRID